MTSVLLSSTATMVIAVAGVLIILSSIVLSLTTRFIQIRTFPKLVRLFMRALRKRDVATKDAQAIQSYKALFTAMSTTIGIASMVSPVIAIKMGGPGALMGFLITTMFGSATTFAEVTFGLHYRKKLSSGIIMGGPMQYLKDAFSPFLATWYAFFGCLLLIAWSANQSNTIADVMRPYGIPEWITGLGITITIVIALFGGIKRVSNLASSIVPTMFIAYVGASCWIVLSNIHKIPATLELIFSSILSPTALGTGIVFGGLLQSLRWGLLKGIHSTEVGNGTAAIPHSMAEVSRPTDQGILAMASVWSVGFISLLTGFVVLLTDVWLNPAYGWGINIIIAAFNIYFPTVGPIILVASAFLFAFGTILGNSYNGSQCFLYLTNNRYEGFYHFLVGIVIYIGTILDIALVWSLVDIIMVCVAVPHIVAIVVLSFKKPDVLRD